MGKLSTAMRKRLNKSQFAIPGKAPASGSYPIPDRAHAKAALSYGARFASPSELATIRAKVKRRFGMGK